MASKNFTSKISGIKNNPREVNKPVQPVSQTKKKPGRPKVKPDGEYKTINISVPLELYNQMTIAKLKYNDNLTEYVNAVIQKDLSENMELYEQIRNLLSK